MRISDWSSDVCSSDLKWRWSFFMTAYLLPIGLLFVSNIFMTFAGYGHLGDISRPVWLAVLLAWGIVFFEYCLAVPANRIGHAVLGRALCRARVGQYV